MFQDGMFLTAGSVDRISPGVLGVRKYDKERCFRGYTLFSPAMGRTEYLIDMNGMVVHTWPVTHSQLAQLLPNGYLMAGNYGSWIEELTPKGERTWIWRGDYHHDFDPLPGGNVVLLIHRFHPVVEGFYPVGQEPDQMESDVVLEIDRQGNVHWEFPFIEHLSELRELAGLPEPVRYGWREPDGTVKEEGNGDWAHTNTVEVLPDTPLGQRDARFRAGNILFSFRSLDIIGVIDRERDEIVWAWGLGMLDGQHQPTMLPNGNILIFDNGTWRGNSAVVEVNPENEQVVWQYEDGEDFFSPFRSGVQRLPNGNTLVCESDAGRIFEVTADKEVVWDYYSPFLAQAPCHQGRHVYRATRYSLEEVEPLVAARDDKINCVASAPGKGLESFREVLRFYQEGFEA